MFRSLLLAGASLLLGLSNAAPTDPQSVSFPPGRTIGGGCGDQSAPVGGWLPVPVAYAGANAFWCSTQWGLSFSPVESITAYMSADGDHIAGFTISYTNKAQDNYGTQSSYKGQPPATISFPPGTLIQNINLRYTGVGWAIQNSQEGWLLAVTIDIGGTLTTLGRQSNAWTDGDATTTIPVNGNLLMGMNVALQKNTGEQDSMQVTEAQFLFLRQPPKNINIGFINYHTPDPSTGIQNTGQDQNSNTNAVWSNSLNDSGTFSFEVDNTYSQSTSFEQDSTSMYGVSVGVDISANIFSIGVDHSAGFTWTTGNEQNTQTSSSTSMAVSCSTQGTVPANTAVALTGNVGFGTATIPYDSAVTVTCGDGYIYSYSESGTMTIADSTHCTMVANYVDIDQAPPLQSSGISFSANTNTPPPSSVDSSPSSTTASASQSASSDSEDKDKDSSSDSDSDHKKPESKASPSSSIARATKKSDSKPTAVSITSTPAAPTKSSSSSSDDSEKSDDEQTHQKSRGKHASA